MLGTQPLVVYSMDVIIIIAYFNSTNENLAYAKS